jgi:hypothetical protein
MPPSTSDTQAYVQRYALYGVLGILFLSVVLPRFTGGKPDTLHDTLETCVALVTLWTTLAPKREPRDLPRAAHQSFGLSASFMNGWYGGIVGGAIAGVISGIAYYLTVGSFYRGDWRELISLILGYSVMAGLFLGAASQLGAQFASHLAGVSIVPAFVGNEAVGGSFGGAVGGIFAGAYGGWIFGNVPTPVVDPVLLISSGVVAAFAVCGGALFYDFRGRPKDLARVFLLSLIPTLCAAMIGFYVIVSQKIGERYFRDGVSRQTNLQGGAYMGAIVGAALGLQIGGTLLFYRLNKVPARVSAPGDENSQPNSH